MPDVVACSTVSKLLFPTNDVNRCQLCPSQYMMPGPRPPLLTWPKVAVPGVCGGGGCVAAVVAVVLATVAGVCVSAAGRPLWTMGGVVEPAEDACGARRGSTSTAATINATRPANKGSAASQRRRRGLGRSSTVE